MATKMIVCGAAGRMGRTLLRLVLSDPEAVLHGATEAAGHPALGTDAGALAGEAPAGVTVGADYESLATPDTVTLDFTAPEASLAHLRVAADRGAAIVLGTTGFSPEQRQLIGGLAPRTRAVVAPNMSAAVTVLSRLATEACRLLGPGFDIEIVELHHRTKRDAPSGTAAALAEAIAAARGTPAPGCIVHGRAGPTGARPDGQLGVFALRGGDCVGEHTVLLIGSGERLELIHRAQSRECFARGAVRAAHWVIAQPPGLYGMSDVLGLSQARTSPAVVTDRRNR